MRHNDARILRFPADRSLGQLFSVYQDEEIYLGEAQGDISVGGDDLILLVLRRLPADGMAFLQDLDADDLWSLCLRDKNIKFEELTYLTCITGLRNLDLGQLDLPDNYIDYIFPLRNLSELDLSGSASDRYQIEALAEMNWLQCLKLGFLEESQVRERWSWRDIRDALPLLNIRYGLMDVCDRWTRLATELDAEFTPPISFDAKDFFVPGPVLERRYKKWKIRVSCSYDTVFKDVSLTVDAQFEPAKAVKMSLGVEDKAYRPAWERNLVGLYTSLSQAVGVRRRVKTGISEIDNGGAFQVSASDAAALQSILGVDTICEILTRPDIVGDQFKFWKWSVVSDPNAATPSTVSFLHQVPFLEFPRLTSAKLRRIISLLEDSLDHLLKIGIAGS